MYGSDVAIFTHIWVSWYETHKVFRGLTMVNGTLGIGASHHELITASNLNKRSRVQISLEGFFFFQNLRDCLNPCPFYTSTKFIC